MTRPRRPPRLPAPVAACGCLAGPGGISFCETHRKAERMAALLRAVRRYLAAEGAAGRGPGVDSPIVQEIDLLIPPGEGGRDAGR